MKRYKLEICISICSALILLVAFACNKPPYTPDKPATYVELGGGDATHGGNNESQPLLSSLRVMTYNIHICNPPSKPGEVDTIATANAIKKGNADIVFLQEVDKNTTRNGYNGDMAAALGRLTQMNAVFYSATSAGRGLYGVAILSKYPIRQVKKYLLSKESDATEQRVLGTSIIDLPGIDSVIAAVTHLQHNSATNRLQQVKDVVSILGAQSGRIIIGGDFNELETATDFFSIFDGAFTRTCKGGACPRTFSAQNPQSVIDYLAYKPSSAFSVSSHNTIGENYASDHLPVIAELKFNR